MDSNLRKIPAAFCAVAIAFVFLLLAALLMPPRLDQQSYSMAFFDKQVLLKTRPSPRIIFVGGSNVAYGIDSALVKRALHRNVINNGTTLGLGLSFMLNSTKKYLRPNDLVVICPEYEHFFGIAYGNEGLADLLMVKPSMISYLRFDQLGKLLFFTRLILCRKGNYHLNKLVKTIFSINEKKAPFKQFLLGRDAFNEDGDIGCLLDKSYVSQLGCWLPSYINQSKNYDSTAIELINTFAKSVAVRGIKVAFCFPYISTKFYSAYKPVLEDLNAKLQSQLQVPIIGSLNTYMLPDECFYDTRYHLLTHYKQLRTIRMLPELSNCLNSPEEQARQRIVKFERARTFDL